MVNKKAIADSESDPKDIKSMLDRHIEFFDKSIELIPARFYLSDDSEKKWFPGLSRAEKAVAKRETSENIKKARRDRLDPEKSSMTTLDLLKQKLEKDKSSGMDNNDDDDKDEREDLDPKMDDLQEDDRSVTYEELRRRLHHRIEELRAGRGGSDKVERDDKNKNKKKQIQQKKRKRDSDSQVKSVDVKSTDKGKGKIDVEEAAKELAFSHIKIGDEGELGKKKKKQKLSKAKELEKALKLETAKKDPEKGDIIAKKHSWHAATIRAAGEKVHDNPKLLKQSIHKEKKTHEKNVEKWTERVESQKKMKMEKQQKRSENIAGRIHEKKMRKIAKREKKLLRPGFEG